MKKLFLPLLLLLFVVGFTSAQRTVTGTITNEDGEPLIGASVLVQGTTQGTVADFDGSYTLEVPEGGGTLVFSFTGYQEQSVELGVSNVIDIVLSEGIELGEVVVTGLGIKREKKALGYGVTTLSNDDVEGKPESDVVRILRGKATGVDITQTSGMAGSGTNVIIRGYSSITGDNQPLFVIDGVPFNTDSNRDRGFTQGGSTSSSRFLDLDPNNIAEISILKGLSATVLYGESGRNGVVLITTKNGDVGEDSNKKFEVSVTQNISQTEIANIPDYQNTFGNGFSGNFGWFFSNWGPAFDVRGSNGIAEDGTIAHPIDQGQYNDEFPQYIGVRYPYQPYESVENFFQNGLVSNTSIAIENNLGNGNAISATYSYLSDEGFTPKLDEARGGGASNYLRKHNFGLGASTQLSNGLKFRGTFNYADTESRIPPAGPAFGGDGNGLFAALLFTPRSIDLLNLPYQNPVDGSNVYYRRGSPIQNPRWTLNNSWDNEKVRRFFSTMEASYEITPWLSALYRLGIDQYTEQDKRQVNRGGPRDPDGRLETSERLNRISDHLLNLVYNFQLSDDFALDGIVGGNLRREKQNYTFLRSTNQFVYGLLNHGNFIDHQTFSFDVDENTLGIYGVATLGFRNFLYLNFQGRNDWTSTLEKDHNSEFYPSASLAFIPTEAIAGLQNNTVLNYLKLRVGYGTSAGYPDPYQTRNILTSATNVFVTGGNSILNFNSVSDRLGNSNLDPEKHEEYEFGLEAKLIQNRVGIDLSLYDKTSSDLIIDLELDPATGFTNTTLNAAQVNNKGVELGLNFVPVRGDFTWTIDLNYTKNDSEVEEIFPGINQVVIDGYTTLGNFARVGEPYAVILGTPYQRGDGGELLVNNVGSYVEGSEIDVIGNPNPNYSANWINDFTYKGLSFGFHWQYIDGGDIYSQTNAALLARGNTVDTDVNRFLPIILPGVKADGTPNDIQTYIGDTFFDAYFGANEGAIFDGTVIRLRSISLSYLLPENVLAATPFGRVSITLAGENLWYNAPNFPEGINFDPEVLSLGVGNGRGFDFRTGPTAKKYGVTLNVTF
ncbi:MAG: SusC/RagA family TonB-linked outer membrane protein [Saprospiraceae bacterium]|nr:SusC/RagA family TonB-linked outer membrane protein [Saprospiraceae bacterium]